MVVLLRGRISSGWHVFTRKGHDAQLLGNPCDENECRSCCWLHDGKLRWTGIRQRLLYYFSVEGLQVDSKFIYVKAEICHGNLPAPSAIVRNRNKYRTQGWFWKFPGTRPGNSWKIWPIWFLEKVGMLIIFTISNFQKLPFPGMRCKNSGSKIGYVRVKSHKEN